MKVHVPVTHAVENRVRNHQVYVGRDNIEIACTETEIRRVLESRQLWYAQRREVWESAQAILRRWEGKKITRRIESHLADAMPTFTWHFVNDTAKESWSEAYIECWCDDASADNGRRMRFDRWVVGKNAEVNEFNMDKFLDRNTSSTIYGRGQEMIGEVLAHPHQIEWIADKVHGYRESLKNLQRLLNPCPASHDIIQWLGLPSFADSHPGN